MPHRARQLQVLVMTHSPQVAGLADHHGAIRKATSVAKAATEIVSLDSTTCLVEGGLHAVGPGHH